MGGRLKNASMSTSLKHPTIIPEQKLLMLMKKIVTREKDRQLTRSDQMDFGSQVSTELLRLTCTDVSPAGNLEEPLVNNGRQTCLQNERILHHLSPIQKWTVSVHFLSSRDKRYGLLLTCLCCRAVQIEMLDDMSTDSFINSLHCFIAIQGAVRYIKCDQGTNFVGAKNELSEALKQVDGERLITFLSEKQCDFSMNTPHSSHAGSVWERQIRTVKNVLQLALAQSPGRLNDASLHTFFYEAMAIENSRPLTVENLNDPEYLEPITPNHLLTTKPMVTLPPPGKFIIEVMYAHRRWCHVQYLAEQFWSRWRKEYLSSIATRQCWHTPRRSLEVEDIVMENSNHLP